MDITKAAPTKGPPRAGSAWRQFQDLACDLVIVGGKMKAIVDTMREDLSYPKPSYERLFNLTAIMGDLVAEVEEAGSQADVLAYSKPRRASSASQDHVEQEGKRPEQRTELMSKSAIVQPARAPSNGKGRRAASPRKASMRAGVA